MVYITKDDYAKFNYQPIDDSSFALLEARAADVIDAITNNFYQIRNIDSDMNTFRAKRFKQAVAKEIEFMKLTGLSGSASVESQPVSQSIGATSITKGSTNSSGDSNRMKSVVADEVYSILGITGLLYRGVDCVL